MPSDLIGEVEAWATTNETTRSEAIRRLVELGLTVGAKPKQSPAGRSARAKELASATIDSLTAGAPNNDEKASWKRRLIKGPEEFREVRVDRPKAKSKS
jgi:cytochrome c5